MLNREEMILLATDDQRLRELCSLSKDALSNALGDAFAELKGYEQNNPHHHLDLLTHALETALHIEEGDLAASEFAYLRIAALFHDIGKPATARRKGDRTVYYGHAVRSREIAESLLQNAGFSVREIQHIGFLIANHDAFISFKLVEEEPRFGQGVVEINKKNVTRTVERIITAEERNGRDKPGKEDFLELLTLSKADAQAQAAYVCYRGHQIDSRTQKVKRVECIRDLVSACMGR